MNIYKIPNSMKLHMFKNHSKKTQNIKKWAYKYCPYTSNKVGAYSKHRAGNVPILLCNFFNKNPLSRHYFK